MPRGSRRASAAEARRISSTRPRDSTLPAPRPRVSFLLNRAPSLSCDLHSTPTRLPPARIGGNRRLKTSCAASHVAHASPRPRPRRRAASGPASRNFSPLVARAAPSVSRYEIRPRSRRFRARARALKRGTPRGTDGNPHFPRASPPFFVRLRIRVAMREVSTSAFPRRSDRRSRSLRSDHPFPPRSAPSLSPPSRLTSDPLPPPSSPRAAETPRAPEREARDRQATEEGARDGRGDCRQRARRRVRRRG